MNLYLYSVRNTFSYLMWDVTNSISHVDTMSSLCLIGFAGSNRQILLTRSNGKYLHIGVCHIPYRIGESVPNAI